MAAPASAATPTILRVTPTGTGNCSTSAPCDLPTAKQKVRDLRSSGTTNIEVQLGGGVYRVGSTLDFRAEDGGGTDGSVVWTAAAGASPVISGAQSVTGWTLQDSAKNIWVANTPSGVDSRQLYVNDVIAPRAQTKIANADISLTETGISIVNTGALGYLNSLPDQGRIELEVKGDWTNRYSPVQSIANNFLTMAQPAWNNNTWGWDTVQRPLQSEREFWLDNSLAFVDSPNEWYVSPSAGKLYYKPADGVDPNTLSIELPKLQTLVSIGGTYDTPVKNLTFKGIAFTGTSWMGPSTDGYANQQNGTFFKGVYSYRPADAFTNCWRGCELFERARTDWYQEPAAVQVSAASNVTFEGNAFRALGSSALGIGNDANAHSSGVGLGASNVMVNGNLFTEIAGHGIAVGGARADAHHPSDVRMTNTDITIQNNTINRAAVDYKDNSGILSTYVTNAKILHNEIANVAYDAIDTGFGWGVNDAGGNAEYTSRGYYNWNTRYTTPTTLKNNTVSGNLIHSTKAQFADGGSVYNLSASPGSVFERNYLYNASGVGLYLDEGTRNTIYRQNVISGPYSWVFTNAGAAVNTADNVIQSNWYNTGSANIPNAALYNNQVIDNVSVTGQQWPTEAQNVICEAGVAAQWRTPINANYLTQNTACGGTNGAVSAPFLTTTSSVSSSFVAQNGSTFAIRAQGADVWGGYPQRDDAYGAIYLPDAIDADGSVSAKVVTMSDSNQWAKSGVMIRNAMDQTGSSKGYAAMQVTRSNGVVLAWDNDGDGYLESSAAANVNTFRPIWVKLTRSGAQIRGSYSFDGVNYVQVGGPITLNSPDAVQDAGIFSTSHDTTQSAVNTFADVRIDGVPAVAASIDVTATATSRKVAGKAVLVIQVTNNDTVPVDVTVTTEFGAKSVTALAPGKSSALSFTTRSTTLAAGTATIAATGVKNNAPVTTTTTLNYPAS